MLKILQLILRLLAKTVIRRYQPKIVGITGSIGKTSAKEAVAAVLSSKYEVRQTFKNYNNELGLPLTILGFQSPGASKTGWLKLLIKALKLAFGPRQTYPEFLVLEMGVDKPGDMDYLLSIVTLQAAVLTYIGTSHLENFGHSKKLAEEKLKIFKGLAKGGRAILNIDNAVIKEAVQASKRQVLSYGLSPEAEVRGVDVIWKRQEAASAEALGGASFKIKYQDGIIPVHLPNVLGEPALSAALAAAAVGLSFGLNAVEISQALGRFSPPAGRLHLIKGLNGSLIIDDTYNAAPQSMLAALEVIDDIRQLGSARKWLVLGDMLELGSASDEGHRAIGKRVAAIPKARLLAFGQHAPLIAEAAAAAGMAQDRLLCFTDHQSLIDYLRSQVANNDLILVKGSQGVRLEKVVKGLMAEPALAPALLVRQGKDWR